MARRRPLIIAAATASLAIGMLAAPAVAQLDPRLAFVNGIPGRVVDVCIGNNEVKSNLRYGRWFQRVVNPGNRTIRFRVARPGNCTGNVLAQQSLPGLAADDDKTLVATRRPDKVVVFENEPVPTGPGVAGWYSRYAGDIGEVVITYQLTGVLPSALPDTWVKGDEFINHIGGSASIYFWATREGAAEAFEGPKHVSFLEGRRTEVILVGSNTSNARFVVIQRANLPL